jgi:hypothetical protein
MLLTLGRNLMRSDRPVLSLGAFSPAAGFLPEPVPHRRLVQLPDRRQLDDHRAHLVLGHRITATSSYVILCNGRRFMPCSPHQATNCAALP